MKLFCFLAEVPYGGELYISIDYGFPDFPATIPEASICMRIYVVRMFSGNVWFSLRSGICENLIPRTSSHFQEQYLLALSWLA